MVCAFASLGTNHAKPYGPELQVKQMLGIRIVGSSSMKNKTVVAGIVTAVWIILGFILLGFRLQELKDLSLNSIGDFLAGFFSPVAFLWLVVGYFQQGEELQLNTRALELQVQELRLSVEHQRELVEVTKADLTLSKEAYERERDATIRQAQPTFRIHTNSYNSGPGGIVSLDASISNSGHTATKIRFDSDVGPVSPSEITVLGSEEKRGIHFDFAPPFVDEGTLRLHYVDGLGVLRHLIIPMAREQGGMLIFMPQEDAPVAIA